jgi:hypothetical protein
MSAVGKVPRVGILAGILLLVAFGFPNVDAMAFLAQRIAIESSWGGLCLYKCPSPTIKTCRRTAARWACTDSQHPADRQVIALFRAASAQSPHFSLAAAGFGATEIRLMGKRSASLIRGNIGMTSAQIKKARLIAASSSYVEKYILQTYTGVGIRHKDDYPNVAITLTDAGGQRIFITSQSQQDFMLPWIVGQNGVTRTSYNIAITHAVLKLLPNNDVNYARLANSSGLEWGIADAAENDAIAVK